MAIRQVSVFIENRKGALSDALRTLSEGSVGLRALSIADTRDFGILRIITDDNRKAAELLSENGYICSVTDVVAAAADDRPGGLCDLLTLLSDGGVDVEYLYAFVAEAKKHAWVVRRVTDNAAAESLLKKAGVHVLTDEDMATL